MTKSGQQGFKEVLESHEQYTFIQINKMLYILTCNIKNKQLNCKILKYIMIKVKLKHNITFK